jgi:hypothetical protein
MKRLRVFVLLTAVGSVALAEDIKTIRGVEYKDVTVSRVEPDGVVIKYSAGIVKVPFNELPSELQEKYHYDPVAGAQFRQQLDDAKVQRERDIALAKAKQRQSALLANATRETAAADSQHKTSRHAQRDEFSQVEPWDNLQSVPTLSLAQYQDQKLNFVGRIVRIHFLTRSTDPKESADGKTYLADLWDESVSRAQICFPAEALPWFTKIVPKFDKARPPFPGVVYGKVRKDHRREIVLDLLGTRIFTDYQRSTIVWR